MLTPLCLRPLGERPLVSVITAAYNYDSFVADAVRSVLGQTYPHLEHIVVDDGSEDATAVVVERLAAEDDRVRLVRRPNGGQGAAFNDGFAASNGEVVLFLDADDRFHPDKVARVLDGLRGHPRAGLVTHKLQEVDEHGRPLDVYPPLSSLPSGWFGERMLADGGLVTGLSATSGLGLRRQVAERIFPLPEAIRIGDVPITALAPLLTEILGIDEPLVEYRWHGRNLTHDGGSGLAEVERRLEVQRQAWCLQQAYLAIHEPDAAERLAPLERSRYIAELRYVRARLANDGTADELHAQLRHHTRFADQPRARRVFWTAAPRLPGPLFARAYAGLANPGPARHAVGTLSRVAARAGDSRRVRAVRDRVAYRLDPRIDRYILEQVVFPALLADPSLRRILFVGCEWYTADYPARFADRQFRTIDIDPTKARYGSADHIVGSVVELDELVAEASFDAIVCSGVIGFGLQDRVDAERALDGCRRALRPGGWLVLGWNDVDDLLPFPVDELQSLRALEPRPLPPFPTCRYPTFSPARHTFDFYRRPPAPDGSAAEQGASA